MSAAYISRCRVIIRAVNRSSVRTRRFSTGAEVVVDEAVVDPRLLGQAPSGDARSAGVDEHALGRVEESLLGGRARRRLGHAGVDIL